MQLVLIRFIKIGIKMTTLNGHPYSVSKEECINHVHKSYAPAFKDWNKIKFNGSSLCKESLPEII